MRVLASAASRRAAAAVGVPRAVQVVPLLVVKNQVPLVASAAVMAMPVTAPLSMSVTLSNPPTGGLRSTRAETGVPTAPEGEPESSLTALSVGDGGVLRMGASLTLVTVRAAVSVAVEKAV